MSHVTVLGLGAMGTALAEAFLAQGHIVTVWNRSPHKAQALIEHGAAHAASVQAALYACDLAVVCVLDYPAARSILETAAGQLAGKTVVNLTNGTPSQARELAAWVNGHGADYLEGGIMVTPELIAGPEAFILYSGPQTSYAHHEETLKALGNGAYIGEDAALAPLYDLALLAAMFGMFGGFLHAAALLSSEKIPVAQATPMIESLLHAMVGVLPQTAEEIDSGTHPQPTSNNRMMTAGLKNILDGSRDQRVRPDLIQPVWALFDHGVQKGLGDLDISALAPLLTESAHADDT